MASAPINYREEDLEINGLEVEQLTVVGVLVERAMKIARDKGLSLSGLEPRDLPGSVELKLDGYRDAKPVCCFEDDRELALKIARALRFKLSRLGLQLVQALVRVDNAFGKKIGEHDMIMEIVSEDGVRLHLSVEIKVRRLWSDAGRAKVRKAHRAECCDVSQWWQAVKDEYCGRLICLAIFPNKEGFENMRLCGDLRMNEESRWRGFFGRGDSIESFRKPRSHESGSRQSQAANGKARAKAKPKAKARQQRPRFTSAVVDELRFDDEGWAELKTLLKKVEKGEGQSAYYANQAKARHHWTERELTNKPRGQTTSSGEKRKKVGGSPGWVAQKHVLVQMCVDWFGA